VETSLRGSVLVFPDIDALSRKAAALFIDIVRESIEATGRCNAAISGGSTPNRLFSLFGTEYNENVGWGKVHIFWVDERCVPEEDDESNYKHADMLWLSQINIPETNIYRIKGEKNPEEEAQRYEESMKKALNVPDIPLFDVILLGMGADGHTASLFPESDSVYEKNRLVIPVYNEKLKINRISMTLPVLNNARHIIFLVAGTAKAPVLAEIIEQPD
jgi:6-phosphogluconolactonase